MSHTAINKYNKALAKYGFDKDTQHNQRLIDFISQAIKERKKLTFKFVVNVINNFLSTHQDEKINKVESPQRPRRKVANYSPLTPSPSKQQNGSSKRRSLLLMLASKKKNIKYAITSNKKKSNELYNSVLEKLPKDNVNKIRNQSELAVYSPEKNIAVGPNGTPYKPCIRGSLGALWREEDPKKDLIQFKKHIPLQKIEKKFPNLSAKPKQFSFIVNKEIIEKKLCAKRECTQRQVTGYSAKEFFEALGVEIKERTFGSFYHLAHRHGHSLGGAQDYNNLDPATAGSNFTTLFRVEAPLTDLLLNNKCDIDTVFVSGEVVLDEVVPIPTEITYKLKWGNGRTFETTINPLDYANPAYSDYVLSRAFMEAQRTPPRQDINKSSAFFKAKDAKPIRRRLFIEEDISLVPKQ